MSAQQFDLEGWLEHEGCDVTAKDETLEVWTDSALSLPAAAREDGWEITGVNGASDRQAFVIIRRVER